MESFESAMRALQTSALFTTTGMLVALYMIRVSTVLALLPYLADGMVSMSARSGIAFVIALFLAVGAPADALLAKPAGAVAVLAVKEAVIGVVLGFAMSIPFRVIEFAGALIDNSAGFNSVQVQNPMSDQTSTPVSDTLLRLAAAVFFAVGGAVALFKALFESFEIWPLLHAAPDASHLFDMLIKGTVVALFDGTVKLAAPALLVLVMTDVAIALLGRSAQKLQPDSLAQPIKGVLAILMIALLIGVAIEGLKSQLLPQSALGGLMRVPAR